MSSREDVDLARHLVATVVATGVELNLTNLSTTTKDFFHSYLKKNKEKHLEADILSLFQLFSDNVNSMGHIESDVFISDSL